MGTLVSALFIDYDNVRALLDDDDPATGARFSNRPLAWLTALATHLPLPPGVEERRIVSRRCYASPHQINSYRRNFTQTGFEVIDCPPLTTHLKNGADITIVMDVIDYLTRYPHIEEYIILSADADFVPVLNRLRKEMKRTAIFTAANTSSAYRNCSDETIQTDFFATHLLEPGVIRGLPAGVEDAPPSPPQAPPLDPALAEAVVATLGQALARRQGRLPFATAAQALTDALGDRLGGNWGGQRTFTALLAAVDPGELSIDWKVQEIQGDVDLDLEFDGWSAAERDLLGEFVRDVIATAGKPIPPLPPAVFTLVFETFAASYRDEQQTFHAAVKSVAAACAAAGFEVTPQEVRFIGTGISMQGYRFGPDADPVLLASLWRMQIFELCGEPDWLREPEDAELLAHWCRAESELVGQARDDFLARSADDFPESESAAAEE
jgi:hypothetical protein